MSWLSFFSGLFRFIDKLAEYLRNKDLIELGERREKSRQEEEDASILSDVDASDPDSVPDDRITRK